MGAPDPVVERENVRGNKERKGVVAEDQTGLDLERLELGLDEEDKKVQMQSNPLQPSMLHRLNPTNPLRIFINNNNTTTNNNRPNNRHPNPQPPSQPPPLSRSAPTPIILQQRQPAVPTLNSTKYTNKISLFLFTAHMVVAAGLVCFLLFKAIQGLMEAGGTRRKEKRVLKHFLPQAEAALLLSITLALSWQKAVRVWPAFMAHFILWSTFIMSLAAGVLLICFQRPTTTAVGVAFIAFAIGAGLYACWVTQRIKFCIEVLTKSLEPMSKFPDLNQPTYWVLGVGFMWMSMWVLAVIGALNFYVPPLVIIGLGLSLMWTAEVMRNVANLTISRAVVLFYLRGMQTSTQFCFQRALTVNLGSACLGSLFVPTIEALRIVARGLNLLEGEDEFMFSCAHCCLSVMEVIFRYGNGWAFVQIAAYGKGFVEASQDTWELFDKREMIAIVDSDITSALCFLTGVCSGSVCVIVVAAWTATVHRSFTATASILAFLIGYLMTRIAMALPHACVSSYYVCYAEDPHNRLFQDDKTIPERLNRMNQNREPVVPTPRFPRQVQ